MENKLSLKLFPNSFRKVSFVLIVIAVGVLLPARIMKEGYVFENREMIRFIGMDILLAGLFILGWTRDKQEDEMSVQIRLRSAMGAIVSSIIILMINPLIGPILGLGALDSYSGQGIMLYVMVFYVCSYYYDRYRVQDEDEE